MYVHNFELGEQYCLISYNYNYSQMGVIIFPIWYGVRNTKLTIIRPNISTHYHTDNSLSAKCIAIKYTLVNC